jgi:hypothetical protein
MNRSDSKHLGSRISDRTKQPMHVQLLFCFILVLPAFSFWLITLIFYIFLLLCWVGVLIGIYKSSHNVSNTPYLNSPLPCSFFEVHFYSKIVYWELDVVEHQDNQDKSLHHLPCWILSILLSGWAMPFLWLTDLHSFTHILIALQVPS